MYKGYIYDVETGFYYCNSRYYSPELRRFIQPKNVSNLNPSSINGLNLYSYANNNSITIAYRSASFDGITSGEIVNSISFNIGIGKKNNLGSISDITFPSLYNTLGFASNVFSVLNGVK